MLSEVSQEQFRKGTEDGQSKVIKLVVWDLDHTIWDGVLLEDGPVRPRAGVYEVIRELDRRGILQSVASKNDHASAMMRLEELGIAQYFLYPQIGWSAKSEAIKAIAASINIGIDTFAFVDDQDFERDEVAFTHPDVLCLNVHEIPGMLGRSEFMPRFVTEDSKNRRRMYMSDMRRTAVEKEFVGPKDEFLATLGMKLTLARAAEGDLERAEELTRRTHQLNTTGYTYSHDELKALMYSERHDLLIASLDDKYGPYGKIGLCLVERGADSWTVKLLLMSCRVMSRGIGTVMINHLIRQANAIGATLKAEFVRTERNRMMLITYRLGNFNVISENGKCILLENDCSVVPGFPPYLSVEVH